MTPSALSDESVVEFLHRFEAIAEREDFDLVEPMIHPRAPEPVSEAIVRSPGP
jgi:hypothetical protein